jgi:hypothetical protein
MTIPRGEKAEATGVLPLARRFAAMTVAERRAAVRRRVNVVLGSVVLGGVGRWFNAANRFAYLSYFPDAIYEYGALPELGTLLRSWTYKNARRNGGDIARLLLLVQNSRRVLQEGVPGDFAELGVHKGNSAKILLDALIMHDRQRSLYLFDTFGGFDQRDLRGVDEHVLPIYGDTSVAAVRRFVAGEEICKYRPGYFPDSLVEGDLDAIFALVHLDCDLYEPTRASLVYFYPRLSMGALVILHDYASGHWPGVPRAVDEFLKDKPERLVLLPDKAGTAVFRKQ